MCLVCKVLALLSFTKGFAFLMGCFLAEASLSDESVSWISVHGLVEKVLSTQGMQFMACVAVWRMILGINY